MLSQLVTEVVGQEELSKLVTEAVEQERQRDWKVDEVLSHQDKLSDLVNHDVNGGQEPNPKSVLFSK